MTGDYRVYEIVGAWVTVLFPDIYRLKGELHKKRRGSED